MNKDISIMLVDDEPAITQVLTEIFKQLNYHKIYVEHAASSAIEFIKKQGHIDIIFLDINLPDINGLEALKTIKSTNKESKVIILSSDATIDNIKTALSNGASSFVCKPFTSKKIKKAIDGLDKN